MSDEKNESAPVSRESNTAERGAAVSCAPPAEAVVLENSAGQEESDEALVRRTLQGNTDAFGALVLRYQDRIFNTLTRFCGPADEAEDLAQETFLKAYRALADFREGSRFYTWLFRIAVNTALSGRRQNTRRQRLEAGRLDASSDPAGDGPALGNMLADPAAADPAAALEKNQMQQRVQESLQQLDPDYRCILLLREVAGLDYNAIAETLFVSRASVKSRLHRARLELARKLKELRT